MEVPVVGGTLTSLVGRPPRRTREGPQWVTLGCTPFPRDLLSGKQLQGGRRTQEPHDLMSSREFDVSTPSQDSFLRPLPCHGDLPTTPGTGGQWRWTEEVLGPPGREDTTGVFAHNLPSSALYSTQVRGMGLPGLLILFGRNYGYIKREFMAQRVLFTSPSENRLSHLSFTPCFTLPTGSGSQGRNP